jgi:hypothetical protein
MGKTAVEIAEFLAEVLSEEEKKAVKEIVDGGKLDTFGVTEANILREIANPTKKDK